MREIPPDETLALTSFFRQAKLYGMTLQEYLRQEGMTLERFGSLVGLSKPSVSKIVRGIQTPRPEKAVEIERATDGLVTAASLLGIDAAAPAAEGR